MVCFDQKYRNYANFYDFNNNLINLDMIAAPTPAYMELRGCCLDIPKDFCAGMESLITVRMAGNSVFKVESGAFRDCCNLCSVPVFSRADYLGDSVFQNCSSLRHFTFPPNTLEIPPYFFDGCSSLTEIEIPERVTSIGYAAFRNSGIKKIRLPHTLRYVDDFAFYGVDLQQIEITFKGVGFGANAITSTPKIVFV